MQIARSSETSINLYIRPECILHSSATDLSPQIIRPLATSRFILSYQNSKASKRNIYCFYHDICCRRHRLAINTIICKYKWNLFTSPSGLSRCNTAITGNFLPRELTYRPTAITGNLLPRELTYRPTAITGNFLPNELTYRPTAITGNFLPYCPPSSVSHLWMTFRLGQQLVQEVTSNPSFQRYFRTWTKHITQRQHGSQFILLVKYHWGDRIKQDETGGECGTIRKKS